MNIYNIFFQAEKLNIIELFIRASILYFVLFGSTKAMGFRQPGILTPYNFLMAAGISYIAASRMVNPKSRVVDSIAIIVVYALINLFISYLYFKAPSIVSQKPIILVKNGKLLKNNLSKAKLTIDNLFSILRQKDAHNLEKVVYNCSLTNFVFWHYIIDLISQKNRNLSLFFNGKPIILIDDGQIIRRNLRKHFINVDLLMSELRLKNIFDISEVKYTILEPNGHFSIIKKEPHRPVTPKDFNLLSKYVDLPLVIINDGKLFEENLIKSGVDKKWLMNNLSMYNVDDIKNIYIATIDSPRKLYVSKKE